VPEDALLMFMQDRQASGSAEIEARYHGLAGNRQPIHVVLIQPERRHFIMAEIIQNTDTPEALVDIRTVTVDKDLPKEARIAAQRHTSGFPMRATAPVRATA